MKPRYFSIQTLFTLLFIALFLHISTSCSNSSATNNDTSSAEETTATTSKKITLGIIPLTDCAPLVIAHEKGYFKKYGLDVEISKEASWANVRDKILTGELDGAHCLFGMPFSVYTGVGGKAGSEMHIAMILNNNGQAITLSKDFCGEVDFQKNDGVAAAVEKMKTKKEPTFAMTFPGGTHDIWLRYWLAASGVDQSKVKIITIPPPQMVANMKVGNMDGFCVGEPWNQVAVKQGIGFTHLSTQDIWKNHPEKALVVNKDFSSGRREDMKKVMKAVLEASIWLDDMKNRAEAAEIIGKPSYVNAPEKEIEARLMGNYDLGCDYGTHTYTDDYMLYHNKGLVNYPRKSHGIWYMNQYVRFEYLKQAPNYKEVADKLILQDVYAEVAKEMGIAIPEDDMQPFTLTLDKTTFDPNNPDGGLAKK
ncbi:ABC transporter substrate-binding protein [Rhodocytophaga rosea]|uniref:ABC transporter substrate-binding protein n=1 Tax=Rhodocytophaga rosea TaxID=2704465 RepID=A0A6C0GG17_9BACT|nr:CmpA/NrtA family ABC transporter substrate-binding protein [Rhodocytophaga rosea]QHT66938.1 ABC transporter substrate-binding protein [Rhodocytophaga rosea]